MAAEKKKQIIDNLKSKKSVPEPVSEIEVPVAKDGKLTKAERKQLLAIKKAEKEKIKLEKKAQKILKGTSATGQKIIQKKLETSV